MRILCLTRYARTGASSRLRFLQFLPFLQASGIKFTVLPLFDDDYVAGLATGRRNWVKILAAYGRRIREMLAGRRFDLVWLEKEGLPWLPDQLERLLLARRTPLVVDYDDALFHRYDQHANPLVRAVLGRKIDRVMAAAELVVAGNQYLADRAVRAGAPWVEILPTVVDLSRYTPVSPAPDKGPVVIGWIGSPSTAPYLEIAADALRELSADGEVKVVVVGAGDRLPPQVQAENRPWCEDTEVPTLQEFDIGIMPLHNSPWELGKCGYKLIQYMACARPVVASPVGVNVQIVDDGVNGFLADNGEQWRKALKTLCGDRKLRQRMGAAGRARVAEAYCLEVVAPKLATLLSKAGERFASRTGKT